MRLLVTGIGRSGSLWLTDTLSWLGLDARHESADELESGWTHDVEVNSHLWDQTERFRALYPEAKVALLVRDGARVVRSAMTRHPDMGFEHWCQEWARRTTHVADAADLHLRIEDLSRMVRRPRLNVTEEHTFPAPADWSPRQRMIFRHLCGATMARFGYEDLP